jgi:hypothetical protein
LLFAAGGSGRGGILMTQGASMLYRSLQRQGDDHRVDMTAIDALMPRRLGRIRVLFKRLVFSASEMGRSRRAVERELEEMHHPFDCIDYWRKS